MPRRAYVVEKAAERLFPAQASDPNSLYPIACTRNKIGLHLADGSDEQKLTVRHKLLYPAGNGKRRVYMSGSASAGKNYSHILSSHTSCRQISGYAQNYTHFGHLHQQRRAAIAEKRQRNTRAGHKIGNNGYV